MKNLNNLYENATNLKLYILEGANINGNLYHLNYSNLDLENNILKKLDLFLKSFKGDDSKIEAQKYNYELNEINSKRKTIFISSDNSLFDEFSFDQKKIVNLDNKNKNIISKRGIKYMASVEMKDKSKYYFFIEKDNPINIRRGTYFVISNSSYNEVDNSDHIVINPFKSICIIKKNEKEDIKYIINPKATITFLNIKEKIIMYAFDLLSNCNYLDVSGIKKEALNLEQSLEILKRKSKFSKIYFENNENKIKKALSYIDNDNGQYKFIIGNKKKLKEFIKGFTKDIIVDGITKKEPINGNYE